MAAQILMPKLGLTMKTGTVLKWLKEVGDPVSEKEPVLEIETEKLSYQIEAPAAGVLLERLAEAGEKYPIACVLGTIGAPGEAAGRGDSPAAAPLPPAVPPEGRVFISPLAKKLAAQLGVDYRQIAGTGPNGRIVKADVERFTPPAAAAPLPSVSPAAPEPGAPAAADTVIPYAGMRRAIGDTMSRAWSTIPMVTHHAAADVTALLDYRARLNAGVTDAAERVSVGELLLKLTATALMRMPSVNASLSGGEITQYSRVQLGMATAVPGGLVVPVIRDAHLKGLLRVSREAKDLARRARDGTLRSDETQGGTFTVSNLGGFGSVDYFTPIINPPQAAILGVGRVRETAVPIGGEIAVRAMLGLSFTYDHRILDGAGAAQFIAALMALLENPARSLLY